MGNKFLLVIIPCLCLHPQSAFSKSQRMTCENWRRTYTVLYDLAGGKFLIPAAQGVDEGDTYYHVRSITSNGGNTVIEGVTNKKSLKFTATVTGRKKIDFQEEDGSFSQTNFFQIASAFQDMVPQVRTVEVFVSHDGDER